MRWNNNRFLEKIEDPELMKKRVAKELVKTEAIKFLKTKIPFNISSIRGIIDENLLCHLSNSKVGKVLKDDLQLSYK